ncbi:nitrogenase component 1 [Candidatus Methanomassiliicoccus intestinalis]|uniref:nitrogenase component 1 n=1 Tax=Candidatus Methanomassiliicoccus intestinalis TaxID=1406512 RepID=UPI0037DD8E8E
MKRIAIYGKGGIGKSTISSNLTAALSDLGVKVLQIGCDPKHDSTRLLTNGAQEVTVLDYLRDTYPDERKLEDVVCHGYKGCLCVEAGGPEPGIGCAGRGIISAFELLQDLEINTIPLDLTIYDVLGDVVCGGFAVPLRDGYADTVYIVTSGEFMSIYAANNILKGTANYNPDRIGGIIFNSRGEEEEYERVKRFAEAVAIPIVASFSRSREFLDAEKCGKTVVEAYPDSPLVASFKSLAEIVLMGKKYTAKSLTEAELEQIVLGRTTTHRAITTEKPLPQLNVDSSPRYYTSRNVQKNEVLHGCAFAGAASTTLAVSGLTTLMHAPRNCTQFAYQLATNAVKRSYICEGTAIHGFARPEAICTNMTEASMIFGGNEDLRNSLNTALRHGQKNIAVITSCPSGIIGDDVENIIKDLSVQHPEATIVPLIEDGNVNGDFMQGVIDACIGLTKAFVNRSAEKTATVNLIGMKTIATNCLKNSATVENILAQLDIKVNCRYLGNTDIADLKNLTAANFNLLLNPDRFSMMLKQFLEDNYDLVFSKNIARPGLKATIRWIREIGETFSKTAEAERIIKALQDEYLLHSEFLRKELENKTVYVASMNRDIDWILEMLAAAKMKVQKAIVIDRPDYTMDYDVQAEYPFVQVIEKYDLQDLIDDINQQEPDMLIAAYPMAVKESIFQRYIPLVPDVGPFGALELADSWLSFLKAPTVEGWRKDGN